MCAHTAHACAHAYSQYAHINLPATVHTQRHTHRHTQTIYMYVLTQVHTHSTHKQVCIYLTDMCIEAGKYTPAHACLYTYTHGQAHSVNACAHTYACNCVCTSACAYMHTISVHTHICPCTTYADLHRHSHTMRTHINVYSCVRHIHVQGHASCTSAHPREGGARGALRPWVPSPGALGTWNSCTH